MGLQRTVARPAELPAQDRLRADRRPAWFQAEGVAHAGARLTLFPGRRAQGASTSIEVSPTLARGRWRIPYRALGRVRALALHDRIVARRLERIADRIDLVHTWPLGAAETLRTARRLGIPTVLERPNAHTRYAYTVVRDECERLGVAASRGSRARVQRAPSPARGRGVPPRRPAALPLGLRRADVPRRGLLVGDARPPLLRLRPRHVPAEAALGRAAGRVHDAVRRRFRRTQGRALRPRGLAPVAGQPYRHVPDRGRVPAGVPGTARVAAEASERQGARAPHRRRRPDARQRRARPAESRGGLCARLCRGAGQRVRAPSPTLPPRSASTRGTRSSIAPATSIRSPRT